MSFLNIFLAGVFLSLGFILTGELALPIGLHIAWNFFQGAVFGFPVSGVAGGQPVHIDRAGKHWLDDWRCFGPEAGGIGILAMLLGAALILLWVKKTGFHPAMGGIGCLSAVRSGNKDPAVPLEQKSD